MRRTLDIDTRKCLPARVRQHQHQHPHAHTCTHMHTHTHTHTHKHTRMRTRTRVRTPASAPSHALACTSKHSRTLARIGTCVRACVARAVCKTYVDIDGEYTYLHNTCVETQTQGAIYIRRRADETHRVDLAASSNYNFLYYTKLY